MEEGKEGKREEEEKDFWRSPEVKNVLELGKTKGVIFILTF